MKEALDNLNAHRLEEGIAMQNDLQLRIDNIQAQQVEVNKMEPARKVRMKENLHKMLAEGVSSDKVDSNRLEQEIIYYIEKIDISEEQVRLKNHCEYFFSIMHEADAAKGKKLGFVLQEIGREINTVGSKAYDSNIQKSVVLMKDELERAKEQVLNVL